MTVIQVPKPPKSAWDPNRPLSTLLQSQIEHLCEAEKRLPHKYKSQIYTNAIKTEGEAAEYIQKVTAAIQRAHADAARSRSAPKRTPKPTGRLAIAAEADESRRTRGAKKASPKKAKKTAAKKTKGKSSVAKTGRKR